MNELNPMPEFTPKQYLLLLVLLIVATSCSPLLNWLFPALAGSALLTFLPPLLGLYQLLLLFRSLGIIHLPGVACYSAIIAPLSVLSFYQFILQ